MKSHIFRSPRIPVEKNKQIDKTMNMNNRSEKKHQHNKTQWHSDQIFEIRVPIL